MNKKVLSIFLIAFLLNSFASLAQVKDSNGNILADTPLMGWMTWNFFADNINKKIFVKWLRPW